MDLAIFTLVLFPAVSELIGSTEPETVAYSSGLILVGKLLALGLGGHRIRNDLPKADHRRRR
jgi:hypothetical protein